MAQPGRRVGVVVAPDARVRHREAVASGFEPLAVRGSPRVATP